jgi:hypothetical protein
VPKRVRAAKLIPPVALANGGEHYQVNRCSSTLVLSITINGRKQTALIDTGSVRNVIRQDVLPKGNPRRSSGNLITAGGHKIPILGKSKFKFELENHVFACEK